MTGEPKMTAHKHAALMALYAQDAAETDEPWLRWEHKPPESCWLSCRTHPKWNPEHGYRSRPRTIRIGEFDVPEPLREVPKVGTPYWVVMLGDASHVLSWTWQDTQVGRIGLKRGLIHLTKEAAELHGRALVSLTEANP